MTDATAGHWPPRGATARPTLTVEARPPPLGPPVLIGDVATPAGGETLLSLLLRGSARHESQKE